ncbi:MAG: acetyl-CoA carboxylase biotin carboxyl carrier protein subunit [Caldisericia bacterium]|nr:acetyl-CoA carboxylase biotin carboxyl carrier protein subunit [Caldisericia bacterium]
MIYVIELNGKNYSVDVDDSKVAFLGLAEDGIDPKNLSTEEDENCTYIKAPMYGVISNIEKKQGDSVKEGEILFILEAMKMENEILAPKKGKIKEIKVAVNEQVKKDSLLIIIQH